VQLFSTARTQVNATHAEVDALIAEGGVSQRSGLVCRAACWGLGRSSCPHSLVSVATRRTQDVEQTIAFLKQLDGAQRKFGSFSELFAAVHELKVGKAQEAKGAEALAEAKKAILNFLAGATHCAPLLARPAIAHLRVPSQATTASASCSAI
jgi:hypothetical protein